MPTQNYGRLEKVLRVGEGRRLKRLQQAAAYVTSLEPDFQKLSDADLRAKTAEFKQRLENGESLDEILFEAFAAIREARLRESDQRMFDVQLMGGIVLHEGDIAEMKTGEGKTFVAGLALYLNALAVSGAHLVTVNDYLAKRDAEWNRGVYERLGVTVGAIQNFMPFRERRDAYESDITYGTNSEFGFDYLRDNMAVSLEGVVQRGHAFAIVDEVDSILIDEARTPLIISGEPETAAKTYYDFARVVRELDGQPATRKTAKGLDETELSGADFLYDEKHKTVSPAQIAIEKVERALRIDNLYDPRNVQLVNHLTQALKAESLYKRDVDYVVQDGEVKIVDEFTGRIMEGRRWSEGLHQAIEAKENVSIREENVTLATITLQNYFRLYEKLGGMTGTAKTEEKEFVEIYGLNVVEIPTNVVVQRDDQNDYIFKSQGAKFDSVVDDIVERHEDGQPVLVGTIAVETSELLSELLKRRGVPHNVLNAKEHEREADIIAQAGRKHAVTIATNMAGRGVDIVLGGNPQHELRKELHAEGFEEGVELDDELRRRFENVRPEWQRDHEEIKELGGLYVLATERHEARRIDNQLRGRSGRQGDPGESRFYLSAQDDLVRLFAGDRIHSIMERFKLPDDQPMESGLLSKQIENAQKKVEEQNFVARKNVLKYDDVMNVQRQVIYEQRRRVLEGQDLFDDIRQWIEEVVAFNVANFTDAELPEEWDLAGLVQQMQALYGTDITEEELREEVELSREALAEEFTEDALETYEEREQSFGADANTSQPVMREIERYVILQVVDTRWREHLENMDYLREGVHLRAMAQKDPLVEYRAEGHVMFEDLSRLIREEVVLMLFHVELAPADVEQLQPVEQPAGAMQYEHEIAAGADVIAAAGGGAGAVAGAAAATALADPPRPQQVVNEHRDIGRNDPCWCGSGKKFKKCHGA
jgi:preprotein translocase subunit SecA